MMADWTLTGNTGTNPSTDFLGTTDAEPLIIKTNGAEAARFDIAGKVGIGKQVPQVRLHVQGDRIRLESADGLRVVDLRADGAALDLQSTNAPLFINGPGQPTFLNPNGGNVGIGTIQPRTPLHVEGRISTGEDFRSAGAVTFFPPDGFAWFHIDNGPAGGRPLGRLRISHGVSPGAHEIVSVLQNGLVGIGTSSPTARLTVEAIGPLQGGPQDAAAVVGNVTNVLQGLGSQTAGLRGINDQGHGVQGQSNSHVGVEGTSNSGTALFAQSNSGVGVWGVTNVGPFAGFFQGNVRVTGTLSKAGGGFKIDHPLDPGSKYLNHSFVESPEMKNIYDGIAVMDSQGEATVELPEWFEATNREFRYQLTSLGAPGPNLYIADEISGTRFRIAGGVSGMRVAWQVTGIRQDAWAQANPLAVEEEKADEERGHYLHPELYNQPEERGIMWARYPDTMNAVRDRLGPVRGHRLPSD
jgi:hypothetical protein